MVYSLASPMIYFYSYQTFPQRPYCCVPATLQWILARHKLPIYDQELIGVELGLRLPQKGRLFFKHPGIIYKNIEPRSGWGTQIEKAKYSINNFFKKYQIPLTISRKYFFVQEKLLVMFLRKHFEAGHDIILRFNDRVYKKKNEKYHGHFSIITAFDDQKSEVIIGDPERPFYKTLSLRQVLFAISDEVDGIRRGLYFLDLPPPRGDSC